MHPYLMYELIKARQAELESQAEHYRAARAARDGRAGRGSRLRTRRGSHLGVPGGVDRPLVSGAHAAGGTGQPVNRGWAGPAEPAGGLPPADHRPAEQDRVPAGQST